MTTTNEQLMLTAIQALRGVCDGARSEDTVGFAGPDVRRGHKLAATPWDQWTGKDKMWAFHIVRKYRRQLATYGIDYTLISEPADQTTSGKIDLEDNQFVISFKPDQNLLDLVRAIPGRRFDGSRRVWTAPVTVEAVNVMNDTMTEHFIFTDAAHGAALTAESRPITEKTANLLVDLGQDEKLGQCLKVMFPFDREIVANIKTVPGAQFRNVGNHKFWVVPLEARAIVRLKEITIYDWQWDEKAEALCDAVLQKANANRNLSTAKSADMFEVPELLVEPYPFQKAGILYALKNKQCIIADEPGLGKTIQALGVMHTANAYPALVVCPTSVTENWKAEVLKVLPIGEDQVVVAGTKTTAPELKDALIIIIGYDILSAGLKEIQNA